LANALSSVLWCVLQSTVCIAGDTRPADDVTDNRPSDCHCLLLVWRSSAVPH